MLSEIAGTSIGVTMFKKFFITIAALAYSVSAQADISINVEAECIAKNMYFEARNQSLRGMIAVGHVTMNRVADERFPNSACKVVYQAQHSKWWLETHGKWHPLKNRCQFSWYCDGAKDIIWANKEKTGETIRANARAWRASVEVAIWTLGYGSYRVNDNTGGAVFYYAHNLVDPVWAGEKQLTVVIGNHTFMK